MAKFVCSFTIFIVAASVQKLTNCELFKQESKNDAKNDWRLDENQRRDQRQWVVNNKDDGASNAFSDFSKLKIKLNALEHLVQQGLPVAHKPIKISLHPSQYNDIPHRKREKPSPLDNALKGNTLFNLYLGNLGEQTMVQHLDDLSEPHRIVKRLARNPKDTKGKKERKKNAKKRRNKRKKDRMKKHTLRLKNQYSNKLKRKEKFRVKARSKQNATLKGSDAKEADPNYDELYQLSIEQKKRKRDSDEEYEHYNDPVPATDEMTSDDWRQAKYSIREKNSSESESAWFDDIDLSNMTDSEIDRRFPTAEIDKESDSEYSESVGKKIRKNINMKNRMVTGNKGSPEEYEDDEDNSGSQEDEEGSGSGSYEDDGGSSGSYVDGSDEHDQPDPIGRPGQANKGGRGVNAKGSCKNGNCEHEEHKTKKQQYNTKQIKKENVSALRQHTTLTDNFQNNKEIIEHKEKLKKSEIRLETPHKIKLHSKGGDLKAEIKSVKVTHEKIKTKQQAMERPHVNPNKIDAKITDYKRGTGKQPQSTRDKHGNNQKTKIYDKESHEFGKQKTNNNDDIHLRDNVAKHEISEHENLKNKHINGQENVGIVNKGEEKSKIKNRKLQKVKAGEHEKRNDKIELKIIEQLHKDDVDAGEIFVGNHNVEPRQNLIARQ